MATANLSANMACKPVIATRGAITHRVRCFISSMPDDHCDVHALRSFGRNQACHKCFSLMLCDLHEQQGAGHDSVMGTSTRAAICPTQYIVKHSSRRSNLDRWTYTLSMKCVMFINNEARESWNTEAENVIDRADSIALCLVDKC